MTNELLDFDQKNLIDLKIKQAKVEFELNFSILSYENLVKLQAFDKEKYSNSVFIQAYVIMRNNNSMYKFIQKANSDNIYSLSYNSDDREIINFLKDIESLKKLDEKEIKNQKIKIKKDIVKLEGAISEIEDMMLESLPRNSYSS